MSGPTRDEWLKALGEAVEPCDPTAVTVAELAEMLEIDRSSAYRHLRKLIDQGRAVQTVKRVMGPSGVGKRVPAYRLLPAQKTKKKT